MKKRVLYRCIIGGIVLAVVFYFDIYISISPVYRLIISILQSAITVSLGYFLIRKIVKEKK